MRETESIWMNGEFVDWADAKVHVGVHGLHYGTGVFEGIRCYETDQGPAVFRLRDGSLQVLAVHAVDATDRLLIPGMINSHYHSHDTLAKGTHKIDDDGPKAIVDPEGVEHITVNHYGDQSVVYVKRQNHSWSQVLLDPDDEEAHNIVADAIERLELS